MEGVTVKRNELLQTVKENRDEHRAVFEKAQEGYRAKAIELLDQRLEEARQGGQIDTSFSLPVPQDHTADYDRVIKMLEMSVDEQIELDEDYFAQYIMDDWSWKRQFVTTNAFYMGAG